MYFAFALYLGMPKQIKTKTSVNNVIQKDQNERTIFFELCQQRDEETDQENHLGTQSTDTDSSSGEEHVAEEHVVEYVYNFIVQQELNKKLVWDSKIWRDPVDTIAKKERF